MILGDAASRILLEVTLGEKPATLDTPEQADYRAEVAREVAEMLANGMVIEIPDEWCQDSKRSGLIEDATRP